MKPTLNKQAAISTNAKYTEEQKTGLLKAWETFRAENPLWVNEDRAKADKFIEELAAKYGKGVKSIVGVLTRYNVYVAKTATKKSANGSQTKLELAAAIGTVLRLTEAETESLSVAGKGALNKIFTALAQSKPIEVLTPGLDPLMTKPGQVTTLHLTPTQKADLVAFLHTLTDDVFVQDTALANPF